MIEQAMTEGSIIRTHILRPTWHFVAPEDLRWMLELTGPRVKALMATYDRKLGLTDAVYQKSRKVIIRALEGGKHLTRTELGAAMSRAGLNAAGTQRLAHLVMRAELDAVICSGPRRGKQFTYALVDERVPATAMLPRDQALFELTKRYFASRGPATVQDYSWWSGLTIGDVRLGIELAKDELELLTLDDKKFYRSTTALPRHRITSPLAHLLPNYDEYFIGFRDRSSIAQTLAAKGKVPDSVAMAVHIIFIDGQIVGGWKRVDRNGESTLAPRLLTRLSSDERRAFDRAVERYAGFLESPVRVR
jgi:hypothetical protein